MNSDYSLKVLGTPRIDTHLIRKEFLQVWKCSVTREQGAVLVMGMVLGWGVTETMCQCINVVQRKVWWLSFQNILALKMDNGKVDIFCHSESDGVMCVTWQVSWRRVTCHVSRMTAAADVGLTTHYIIITIWPDDAMLLSTFVFYFIWYLHEH